MSRYETQLNSFASYFSDDERYGVDEKLREASEKEQLNTPLDAACTREEGSFRKLNFD